MARPFPGEPDAYGTVIVMGTVVDVVDVVVDWEVVVVAAVVVVVLSEVVVVNDVVLDGSVTAEERTVVGTDVEVVVVALSSWDWAKSTRPRTRITRPRRISRASGQLKGGGGGGPRYTGRSSGSSSTKRSSRCTTRAAGSTRVASGPGSGGGGAGAEGGTGGGGGPALPRAAPQLVQKRASGARGDPQVGQNPPGEPPDPPGSGADGGGWSVMAAFLLLRGHCGAVDT